MKKRLLTLVFGLLAVTALLAQAQPRVLVFSKTAGFRHASIEAGKAALQKMWEEKGFAKVVLEEKLDEPMELAVLPGNKVLFIQRKGEPETYEANGQTRFQFIRENGEVTGVKLMPPGISFTGIKQ